MKRMQRAIVTVPVYCGHAVFLQRLNWVGVHTGGPRVTPSSNESLNTD